MQKRRKTTGIVIRRHNSREKKKNNDEVELEAETPIKKPNTTSKNNQIEQNQKKRLKYLLHNKNAIIKKYRDLLSRREKARKLNNSPCLLEAEWDRKCKFKKKYFGTMLLPRLTWPISGPTLQTLFLQPRPFGAMFTVVSAEICRFSKTRFWSSPGAPPRKTKMRMGAPPEIEFAIFQGAWFWGFAWPFQDQKPENPIFPAVLGMCALYWQLRTWDSPEARVRGHRWNTETGFATCLVVSMLPQDDAAYFLQLLQ